MFAYEKTWPRYGFVGLMLYLLFTFIISPFLPEGVFWDSLTGISLLLVLMFVIGLLAKSKLRMFIGFFLFLPVLIVNISRLLYFNHSLLDPYINLISFGFSFLFLSYVMVLIMDKIFSYKVVNIDIIFASICVYFLIGLIWAFLFSIIYSFDQNAFGAITLSGEIQPITLHASNVIDKFVYFSFVTLTTLGYGDTLPLNQEAQFLCSIEAVIGQIYLTVLVARLVGMHISQKHFS